MIDVLVMSNGERIQEILVQPKFGDGFAREGKKLAC